MTRAHTRLAALAALLLGWSCSDYSVTVTIDPSFTNEQRAELERAADAWNQVAVRHIRFVDAGEYLILPALVPGGWLGYTQRGRALVRVSPATPESEVYAVALHELGHVLGLEHTTRGVMDPRRQTVDFSAEDMVECARVGAC